MINKLEIEIDIAKTFRDYSITFLFMSFRTDSLTESLFSEHIYQQLLLFPHNCLLNVYVCGYSQDNQK